MLFKNIFIPFSVSTGVYSLCFAMETIYSFKNQTEEIRANRTKEVGTYLNLSNRKSCFCGTTHIEEQTWGIRAVSASDTWGLRVVQLDHTSPKYTGGEGLPTHSLMVNQLLNLMGKLYAYLFGQPSSTHKQ
jgi:hypothetical protein